MVMIDVLPSVSSHFPAANSVEVGQCGVDIKVNHDEKVTEEVEHTLPAALDC